MRAFQITTQRLDTVSTKEDIDDKGEFEWVVVFSGFRFR